jgi:DNA-binding beta-propeller fold protein YncE
MISGVKLVPMLKTVAAFGGSSLFVGLGFVLGSATAGVSHVGDRGEGGVLVNTGDWIDPDGKLTIFSARPVDLVLSPDGRTAYLKENAGLTIIDSASGKILQRLPIKGGASLIGLAISADGSRVYTSNADSSVVRVDTSLQPAKVLDQFEMPKPAVGGSPYPCGLVVHGNSLFVALSRSNQVAQYDVSSKALVRTFDVSPAPFGLVLDATRNELWVSAWGRTPKAGEAKSDASGTPVAVDKRGIATGGAVCQIDLASGKVLRTVDVGLQPSELLMTKRGPLVVCANSDVVERIDRESGKASPFWKSGLSSAPTSICRIDDNQIAVTCGGLNQLSVIDENSAKPVATFRSAWYPIAVRNFGNALFVASAKGVGERGVDLRNGKLDDLGETEKFGKPVDSVAAKKLNVFQFTGALSVIPKDSAGLTLTAAGPPMAPRSDAEPLPVPERPGEPSVFKHVVYVLKENRTYDQVLGDIGKGDSDPELCIYGENISPNHHALAREFALLDNYYCNGVLSADGHSWSTEGNATSYFERAFGGWTRSYPYGGDDPLAISNTGHIWDSVLDKKMSFRNYGEYDLAEPANGEKYLEILKDFQSGERKIKFKHSMPIERLKKHSDPDCPGWNLQIPDVLRVSYFLRDLKAAEASGNFPSLNFVYLPQDHTSGGGAGALSPESHVADNDLALGQLADAVSHSRFWKDTVIFVIEDDPQAGFDHVDGHRSLCLVISPYTRRRVVVSTFYNQAGVLRTISNILGVKPVTRFEQQANLFTDCFVKSPNLAPYTLKPNRVRLDRMNAPSGTKALDLSKPDLADESTFNRQLWALAKGSQRYPAELAGAHGTGLAARGLTIQGDNAVEEADEDD